MDDDPTVVTPFEVVRARLSLVLTSCLDGGAPYSGTVVYTLRYMGDTGTMDTGLPIHTAGSVVVTSIKATQGKRTLKVRTVAPTIAFQEGADLRVGDVDVAIGFTGRVNSVEEEPIGLYACGSPPGMLCTFFEVAHARRSFPCADDPSIRIPWSMVVEVGVGRTVVANMEAVAGGNGGRVEFPETPPLPTYLLGFVVVPGGLTASPSGDRWTVLVPRGVAYPHAAKVGGWATAALALCEEYFAVPLDVAALRIVMVPRMALGGMECHGLVMLNCKKGDGRSDGPEALCELLVHEVAHHWVGNMVGLPFNVKEGLAQYFEARLTDAVLGRAPAKAAKKGVVRPTNGGALPDKVFTGAVYTRSLNEVTAMAEGLGDDGLREALRSVMARHMYTLLTPRQCAEYFSPQE